MPRYVEKKRTVEAVQFNNGIIMPDWMKDAVNAGIIFMRNDDEHEMLAVVHYLGSDTEQVAKFGDYLVYDEFNKDIRVEPKDDFEYHFELESDTVDSPSSFYTTQETPSHEVVMTGYTVYPTSTSDI